MELERVMIGIKEMMKLSGLGRNAINEIIYNNEFPTIKSGRKYLVHKDVFNKWLQGQKIK